MLSGLAPRAGEDAGGTLFTARDAHETRSIPRGDDKGFAMERSVSSGSATPRSDRRLGRRALVGTLLLLSSALAFGSLWLPWRHYRVPPGTTYVSPEDLAPYVPIADGWAHSYMVFTVLALAAGAVAWIITARRGSQVAPALALGSLLLACAGALFAAFAVDGATLWRSNEATDFGLYVYLAGYVALAAAGAILLAASIRRR